MTGSGAGRFALGDLTVDRLGFGAMRLTGSRPFSAGEPSDRDTSIAMLRRAVDRGVDHVDTAAFYFSRTRSANELINTALAPYPDDLVIVTKVGPHRGLDGSWNGKPEPADLRGQVEENLRQLGRDHLSVVNYRTYGPGPVAEHVGALHDLVTEGLVRHVGVSNVTVEQLDEALTVGPVVCVQNRYSLDSDHSHDVLARCGELGIAFVPFFAIAGPGREAGATEEVDVVGEVAAEVGASPAQVRIAYTLHQGDHVLAIPGTSNPDHLDANLDAGRVRLTDDQVRRLGQA
ncbi:aldo/keto reductase [Nocardioides sp.]|uniref:aldo/keto reductase n=1 Tax=Nocardioides sp. TaxID=35761 RepID=UPI0027187776|nr:aldo/keto reductase [Nocardioides sp.]MDO9454843.1 aldo/keto reductase [Nocardioides sp.]